MENSAVIEVVIDERRNASGLVGLMEAPASEKHPRRKTSYTPQKILRDYILSAEPFYLN